MAGKASYAQAGAEELCRELSLAAARRTFALPARSSIINKRRSILFDQVIFSQRGRTGVTKNF